MSLEVINNIDNLIPLPGKKILWHEIQRLTAPGENYGSLMLSVDLTVATKNGNEKVHTVAKMVPPNEFIQKIFNTQVTFRNEIAFYKKMVPLLQDFQRENGVKDVIDFSAKCYGARANLTDNEGKVDSDAALVLENLKYAGYITFERTEGLDLEAARLVLTNLALFHAVPLALKLKKPEIFEEEIKPYLDGMKMSSEGHETFKNDMIRLTEASGKIEMKDKIVRALDKGLVRHEAREPFATVVHNDCWSNNSMFKLEGDDDKPVKSILVDYQVCGYGSPARDVIFFLFSSVRNSILKEHYDDLIKFYHDNFMATLQELDCDLTPFTFEAFQEELDFEARHSQFSHVSFMLFPIYAPREQVKDISELGPDTLSFKDASELQKEKWTFVLDEFNKRNWI